KLTRFMLHLEGAIQNHAQTFMENRGANLRYEDLVSELRRSFQRKIDVNEAESQLHGRKWNPYEVTIAEFLHDTRLLVQQAYPGEQQRWDTKTRACLCRALPIELERIVASNTREINDLVEWVRTYTRGIVQGMQPSADAEVWVKNCYELYHQKSSPLNRDSGEKITEASGPPRVQSDGRPPPGRPQPCYTCQSIFHRAANCPHGIGVQRNPPNVRQDRAFYPSNVQPSPKPL
ncbi:MAG: hypothetical protein GY820_33170, partial [Gammaproteobacteria bacterium]|nr:hypothetical protein [Gammaproteobacteria bacterium]